MYASTLLSACCTHTHTLGAASVLRARTPIDRHPDENAMHNDRPRAPGRNFLQSRRRRRAYNICFCAPRCRRLRVSVAALRAAAQRYTQATRRDAAALVTDRVRSVAQPPNAQSSSVSVKFSQNIICRRVVV